MLTQGGRSGLSANRPHELRVTKHNRGQVLNHETGTGEEHITRALNKIEPNPIGAILKG